MDFPQPVHVLHAPAPLYCCVTLFETHIILCKKGWALWNIHSTNPSLLAAVRQNGSIQIALFVTDLQTLAVISIDVTTAPGFGNSKRHANPRHRHDICHTKVSCFQETPQQLACKQGTNHRRLGGLACSRDWPSILVRTSRTSLAGVYKGATRIVVLLVLVS